MTTTLDLKDAIEAIEVLLEDPRETLSREEVLCILKYLKMLRSLRGSLLETLKG